LADEGGKAAVLGAVSAVLEPVGDHQQVGAALRAYQRELGRGSTEGEQGQRCTGLVLRSLPEAPSPAGEKDEGFQRLRETCHEIRQPVAGVLALAGAALADPGLPEVTRSYLEQIVTQAQALADVIRQRLVADESGEAQMRLTDLRRLADEAATAERVTYGGDLEVVPGAEPVLVCVNQLDVRGIISNLLSNATRAAGPMGSVRVEISHDSCLAQLVVEDTGPGFGNVPGGAGLGWCIMARGLARCGGKISYGQSALGGVRASFWLPLAAI
jgi:signal transduction histidine kinase